MTKRSFWAEEMLRWYREQREKQQLSTDAALLKKESKGQLTLPLEEDIPDSTDISRELEVIAETGMIEEYRIGESMGQGADAAVYKAEKNGQEFIIKVPLTNGESKTRLKNEMDISIKIGWLTQSKLKNGWVQAPHIIQMLDCRKGDLTFAVLEMLEKQIQRTRKRSGTTRFYKLAALEAAASEGQHSTRVALYTWDTLHALEFMHSMDIVHRDIKYQNSMATHRNGKLASVLFDLGTALELADEKHVRSAQVMGSPAYLPKQVLIDIYKNKDATKGGFRADTPLSRIKTILKRGDYGALAHSIAHLLTGMAPYDSINADGETTSVFDTCSTKIEFVNAALSYEGDPINYDLVRKQLHGEMFAAIIERLLDPMIVSRTELDGVRAMLENGMQMEGLFTRYRTK
ncbi:hypothetical protein KY310_01835 [Candidatus Woesearchaeota archaeon]|nr:hypothetical protein [Candidatus Woesearchaeota archaeon]